MRGARRAGRSKGWHAKYLGSTETGRGGKRQITAFPSILCERRKQVDLLADRLVLTCRSTRFRVYGDQGGAKLAKCPPDARLHRSKRFPSLLCDFLMATSMEKCQFHNLPIGPLQRRHGATDVHGVFGSATGACNFTHVKGVDRRGIGRDQIGMSVARAPQIDRLMPTYSTRPRQRASATHVELGCQIPNRDKRFLHHVVCIRPVLQNPNRNCVEPPNGEIVELGKRFAIALRDALDKKYADFGRLAGLFPTAPRRDWTLGGRRTPGSGRRFEKHRERERGGNTVPYRRISAYRARCLAVNDTFPYCAYADKRGVRPRVGSHRRASRGANRPAAMIHIVLFNPEIPQNTGNVGRMCALTRSRLHLIHPLGYTIDDRNLRRAGMDYWRSLDVHEHSNWEAFRASAAVPRRLWLFTTKTKQSFWQAKFADGDGLLFGNEGSGAPDWLHAEIGEPFRVTIPHANPELRSLNLSTAAGVACYEALRQTRLLS